MSAVASTAPAVLVPDTVLEFRLPWRRRLAPVAVGALGVSLGIGWIAEWLFGEGPAVLATDDPFFRGLLAITLGGLLAGRGLRQRVVVESRGVARYQVFRTRLARWQRISGVSVVRDARGGVRDLFVWKRSRRRALRPGRGLGRRLTPLALAVEAQAVHRGIPVSQATRRTGRQGTVAS